MNQLTFDDLPPAVMKTISENHRAGQLFHFIAKHYHQSERKASNQDRIIADYVYSVLPTEERYRLSSST